MKKLNYDEVKEYIKNIGYILIDKEYLNARKKLTFIDSEQYFLYSSFDNLKHNYIPMRFHKNNPYTIQNIKHWCKLNKKPFELISSNYVKSNELLKWKCLKCGDYFLLSWGCILNNVGCGVCHGRQIGLSNCLATKNPDLASEWHPTKNDNLTPYDVTCGSSKRVWWKCKECGHEWKFNIKNRNSGTGCPECNKSKGEKAISNYLNRNIISFESQKKFRGLVGLGNGNLSYDFYIPSHNLLIEFHGLQHMKYIKGFHKSEKDFFKQQEHDKRKSNYANKNNIQLLIIWQDGFKYIEQILDEYLLYLKLKEVS